MSVVVVVVSAIASVVRIVVLLVIGHFVPRGGEDVLQPRKIVEKSVLLASPSRKGCRPKSERKKE